MSFSSLATGLVLMLAASTASGSSLRANLAPRKLVAETHVVTTIFSDAACANVVSGVGMLLGFCSVNRDGTSTKSTYTSGTTYDSKNYMDSTCSESTTSSSPNLVATCTLMGGAYMTAILTSSPSFVSTTAGVTGRQYDLSDTTCASTINKLYYYAVDLCIPDQMIKISYAETTITGTLYFDAPCMTPAGAVTWTDGVCAMSNNGASGYETATIQEPEPEWNEDGEWQEDGDWYEVDDDTTINYNLRRHHHAEKGDDKDVDEEVWDRL